MHLNKVGFNTFGNNTNQMKNSPKINKNNIGKNINMYPNSGKNCTS